MRSVVALVICFGALQNVQNALAADLLTDELPPVAYTPIPIWTGFYFGGHIGGVWGDVNVGDTYQYNSPDPFKETDFSTSGIISGIQLGYNVQNGAFVYGVEADLGYMALSGSENAYLPPLVQNRQHDLNASYDSSGGLYGDLVARLGYTQDNILVYVKGGVAFINADFNANYVGANCTTTWGCDEYNPSTFEYGKSETLLGWTLGVGVEYALDSKWSLKAEYQHFDFESISFDHVGEHKFSNKYDVSQLQGSVEIEPTVDVVKFGVNYKLGDDIY